MVSVSETCEGDPAIIHSALSQLPSIVLPPTASEDARPELRTAPPSPAHSQGPDTPSRKTAATFEEDDLSEDLMSSASFLGSSSDLARSPTLTASSSVSTFELPGSEEADMDASMISASEIEVDGGHESIAGLRRRRRPSQLASPSGFTSALASSSLLGYEADNDHSFNDDADSLHALDESMFSDPDIEGLAFQPFPSSSRATEPTTPPRSDRQTSRSGNVILSASSPPDSPSQLPPRRTVIIDELILRALELSRQYPIGSPTASSDLLVSSAVTETVVDADISVQLASPVDDDAIAGSLPALQADRVLGANSCINTWHQSMNGLLTDAEAETIVRNGEGIVFVEALGPDLDETETLANEDDESLDDFGDADADADEYDIVPSPGDADASNGRRRRRRNRRSSSTRGGRIPPLLALGPHGWLVVSGVAVAAVAYGVYRQQGGGAAAAAASSGAHGLGTARLGLGFGGGGFGGAAAAGGGPAAVEAAGQAGAASLFGAGGRLV